MPRLHTETSLAEVMATKAEMSETPAPAAAPDEVAAPLRDEVDAEIVAVGIDLGTTNSVVAIFDAHKLEPRILRIDGNPLLPSVVWMKPADSGEGFEPVVGDLAINAEEIDPKSVIRSVKRYMGEEKYPVEIGDKSFTPEEISAEILKKILRSAEDELGKKVTHAVITTPANFTEPQRNATKRAGVLAGLPEKNIQILAEPSAAGFAYMLTLRKERKANILVYDLGGGTFDVVILKMIGERESDLDFEIVGEAGDNHLGGDDFDIAIAKLLADDIKTQSEGKLEVFDEKADNTGMSAKELRVIQARLKRFAEKAKIELSEKFVSAQTAGETNPDPTTEININNAVEDGDGNTYNVRLTLSYEQMKTLIATTIQGTAAVIDTALEKAGMTKDDINRVILVGGSTKLPMVRDVVVNALGKEPYANVNPSTAVAEGAAVVSFGVKAPNEVSNIGVGLSNLGFELLIDSAKEELPFTTTKTFRSARGKSFVEVPLYKTDDPAITMLEPGRDRFLGKVGVHGLDPAKDENIEVTFTMNADRTVDLKVVRVSDRKEFPGTFTVR